jgi:hypothetical protein
MSFNLFAFPSIDDIRVGYIDPTLGYVEDVTICEANSYAKDNPGTTFIFRDGNNTIRYLNINEVNNLTPNDLIATEGECGGIQVYKECGPPRIQFFGGGGIGAAGNPIIGRDGSLLAVDVIRSGHGYQYAPIVAAKDDCQLGNGVVLTAVLGETADETEVFEGEEDFEEYQICEDTDVGYGIKYGPNGEELGAWEPNTYTRIGEDPIKREIEIYQKALKKPFWTTRETEPDRIIALEKQYPNPYKVTHPQWGEFMNQYAISPVKPSDVTGSDEAGKVFTLEWEQNFPISGEYIFRGVCDNTAQVYIDDQLVGDLKDFKQNPSPLQKTIQEGNHIIKIDLLNVPITEKVSTSTSTKTGGSLKSKFIQQGSSFYLQVDGEGSGEISFVMDVNDAYYVAGLAAKEVLIPSDNGKIKFQRQGIDGFALIPKEETIKKSGKFTAGKKYGPIEILGAGAGARGPILKGSNTLGIRDADGDDLNIKITISNTKGNSSEKTTTTISDVVSSKSWNTNPMGVSMIIDAPLPPIPQEQPPVQTGRCPPNPIWSTRFPGSNQRWYPVRNKSWTNFFNRYAISPVLPLDTPGSDGSGITHRNSWSIEIPYRGFYKFQAQRDNTARIYVDGKLAFDVTTSGDDKWVKSGLVNRVKSQKVFLEKGLHTISIELENTPQDTPTIIDQKIFSTQDWRVPGTESAKASNLKPKFIQQGSSYYLQVDGNGSGEISFVMDVNDAYYVAGLAAKQVIIPSENGKIKFEREGTDGFALIPKEETIKKSGKFTAGKKYGPIEIIGSGAGSRGPILNGSNTLGIRDADGDDLNIKITIGEVKSVAGTTPAPKTSQSITKNGVTYEGPEIFAHQNKFWGNFMNNYSVSPKVFNSIGEPDNRVIGKYTLTWKNVDFPYDGNYKFNFQADSVGLLKIGGREIIRVTDFQGEPVQYTANITKGKYDVSIEVDNLGDPTYLKTINANPYVFLTNPIATSLYISKDVVFSDSNKTSWIGNPMGIGAILIPPPCAKKIGGKGVVEKVIVNDPGNGYLPPEGGGYPVTLVLDEVIVEDPGINYSCGEDQIQITPSNGAQLEYDCDPFGKIRSVKVVNPGIGFNTYPEITIPSETGVNASFRPVFRVVRDPIAIEVPAERLIQVTDLVGLKQTGYVDGRAYYGAVYYDEGIPYAGYYKTVGTQVRIYNTLQESITATVTTPPSAIQRSGTDIRSNDPNLNIPGTPQSTTEEI